MFSCFCYRIQDVFKWQLEVEDDVSNADTGRIVWSIEYERTSKQELYISQESRIVSHINIQSQKKDHLVPVVKVNKSNKCFNVNCLLISNLNEKIQDGVIKFCFVRVKDQEKDF